MGFGTPLALFALAAAAAPVLIHLMRRRDLPVIALPTVVLLERARVTSRRRFRLIDLLLLLCRVLLVVAAVLGAADPFTTIELAYGDGRPTSVAIMVDDSMSMTAERGGTSLLSRSLDRAVSAIDALPVGSEVAVIATGNPARVLAARSRDLDVARLALAEVPLRSARGNDVAGAALLATRELSGSRNAARRLLVLSDDTEHSGLRDATWPEGGIAVDRELASPDDRANYAFRDVQAVPDPSADGQVSIRFEVRGYLAADRELAVSLSTPDAQRVAATTIEIVDGVGRGTLHAPVPETGPGVATLTMDVEDAIDADDQRALVLRPVAASRVLIVDGEPSPATLEDEVGLFLRALALSPENVGAIDHQTVDPDAFDGTDLDPYDVVVLANVRAPSEAAARRLIEFVEAGGGLLVTAGDQIDVAVYERRLDALLPARLGAQAAGAVELGFERPRESPLLPDGGAGLAEVKVTGRMTLEEIDRGTTHLRFTDASAALVTANRADGRVALLATTIDDDWTDLPFRPGFLPLAIEIIRFLTGAGQVAGMVATGDPVPIPRSGDQELTVEDPLGARTALADDATVFAGTREPGAYRVLTGTGGRGAREVARTSFVVAPPTAESDLTPVASSEDDDDEVGDEAAAGTVIREPIGRWFFLAVALLALLEVFLRTHRSRTAPATGR